MAETAALLRNLETKIRTQQEKKTVILIVKKH